MCVLCSQFLVDDHWSEAVAGAPPDEASGGLVRLETHAGSRGRRLLARAERARLVGRVLAAHAITLQDWEGSSYILRDPKGNAEVVHDLAAVWAAAERMAGGALDPLDPAFLAALRERNGLPPAGGG